jgi:hypothetical protein
VLPVWITLDTTTDELTGDAGYFRGDTTAAANAAAQTALNQFANDAILHNKLKFISLSLDLLSWNRPASCIPYDLVLQNAGTASFTPITGLSNSFTAFADVPDCMNDQAYAANGAMLTYNGPAANCNLRLDLFKIGGSGRLTNGGVAVRVAIVDSTCTVLSIPLNLFLDPAVYYTGTFDFPFTIPDTGGSPITISLWVQCGNNFSGSTSEHLQNTFTGTFSNISVSGPNWSWLDWNVIACCYPYLYAVYGSATASFTPITGLSSSFSIDVDYPNYPADSSDLSSGAMLTYNGPAQNCNLRLVFSSVIPADSGATVADLLVAMYIVDSGCGVLSTVFSQVFDPKALVPGTFDFPFTIPDTGGSPITLSVRVIGDANANAGISCPIRYQIAGTFIAV